MLSKKLPWIFVWNEDRSASFDAARYLESASRTICWLCWSAVCHKCSGKREVKIAVRIHDFLALSPGKRKGQFGKRN